MNTAVTGAFGYSGRYIAQRLLQAGHKVLTLTNSASRQNPFGEKVQAVPFNFDQPARLTESLKGVEVLINTYWVRFDHKLFTHAQAVANTRILFEAAKKAGAKGILVKTGYGGQLLQNGGPDRATPGNKPDFIAADILEAVKWILKDRE